MNKRRINAFLCAGILALCLCSCGTNDEVLQKEEVQSETETGTETDSWKLDTEETQSSQNEAEMQSETDTRTETDSQKPDTEETQSSQTETETQSEAEIGTETDSREPGTEAGTNVAEPSESYTYIELAEVMYISKSVNVRALPSTAGEKLGSLRQGQEVTVTGQCNETLWYRILFNDGEGYISNNYVTAQIPVSEPEEVAIQPEETTASHEETITQPEAQDSLPTVTENGLVVISSLSNKKSLQKKCTDEEFQMAYDAAAQIVTPLVGLSREEQLYEIASVLRYMVDSGQVLYSTEEAHYDDPYGYFVAGVSSCAGCARATGLCLNMLGIEYEHVNEGQWSHQWCRVNIDGTYWICDAYGLYVGPEFEPYKHPYLE